MTLTMTTSASDLARLRRIAAALEARIRARRLGALTPIDLRPANADPTAWLQRVVLEVPLREVQAEIASIEYAVASDALARLSDPAAVAAARDALAAAERDLAAIAPAYAAAKARVDALAYSVRERRLDTSGAETLLATRSGELLSAERELAACRARADDVKAAAVARGFPVPPSPDLDALALEVA